jgi:hypothetical protein
VILQKRGRKRTDPAYPAGCHTSGVVSPTKAMPAAMNGNRSAKCRVTRE